MKLLLQSLLLALILLVAIGGILLLTAQAVTVQPA